MHRCPIISRKVARRTTREQAVAQPVLVFFRAVRASAASRTTERELLLVGIEEFDVLVIDAGSPSVDRAPGTG